MRANDFIRHYVKPGYYESRLKRTASEIPKNEDYSNFNPNQDTENHNKNSDRIPLVINWHRNFTSISKVLQDSYEHF